ncbi:MAG: hypothetical protein J7L89_10315 [Bacteroidales bacterium]|nr:hypothetical protein [Bacteroidales bacterium]
MDTISVREKLILLFFVITPTMLPAQDIKQSITSDQVRICFDPLYQTDARLISGDFYQTPAMSHAMGNPFFIGPEWKQGYVVIHQVQFDHLLLRYDVYSNKLVLNWINGTGPHMQIALKNNNIDRFTLNSKLFRPCPDEDSTHERRFCEVLVNGPVNLLLLKSRKLAVSATGNSDYVYDTNSKKILQVNHKLINYHGKRTLFRLFPELKNQLQNYISREHLTFWGKKDVNHIKLVTYCNSLLKKPV